MYLYLLGLGSNIEPERNLPRIVSALLEVAGVVHVSPIWRTTPRGMPGGDAFLNACAALRSPLQPAALKAELVRIEQRLGRDRSDPQRSIKSRTADIDVLAVLDANAPRLDGAALPSEPYVRPLLDQLLAHLGLREPTATATAAPGVALDCEGERIGDRCLTLHARPRS